MKIGTKDYIMWLIMLVPFLVIAYYWSSIPDRVPTHWNGSGEVDSYGSRYSIFIMPAVAVGSYFLVMLLPYIDPRKKNYELFADTLKNIQFALVFFMSFLSIGITLMTINKFNLGPSFILIAVYLLIMLLGNLFGKVRPNFFIGIRTPWTLSDETVWIKTHRLAGKLWVFGSLIMIFFTLFIPSPHPSPLPLIIYTAVVGVIPITYSFILYKKLHKADE